MAGPEHELIEQFLLAASREGWRFARNNSGLAEYPGGEKVRYGLFQPGGSDCIGWIPKLVTPADVGREIAIFAAAEMKTGKQVMTEEQYRFQRIVQRAGGTAAWGRDVETIMKRLHEGL